MTKFNVGDRVKITDPCRIYDYPMGTEFTVKEVNVHPHGEYIDTECFEGARVQRFQLVEEKPKTPPEGLVSVMLTDETVLAAVAIAVSKILKEDVKIESLTSRNDFYDPGAMAPANPSKWEAQLVKQS